MSLAISILIVISSSLWVYIDSKKLLSNAEIRKNAEFGPGLWLAACLLLWIVAFPCYIVRRAAMKKIDPGINAVASTTIGALVIFALIFNALAPSMGWIKAPIGDLETDVLASVQETFASNPDLSSVKVNSVTLVHDQGNQYDGVINAEYEGDEANFGIDVTYDGKQFIWQLR